MRLRREASVKGSAGGLGCPVRACPHTVEACEASVSSAIKIICNARACPLRDTAVNGLHCGSCNKCIAFNDCPPYRPGALPEQVVRLLMCDCACARKHAN